MLFGVYCVAFHVVLFISRTATVKSRDKIVTVVFDDGNRENKKSLLLIITCQVYFTW